MLPDQERDYVRAKAALMHSRAMYRKLRALVSSWEREERGKAKVASRALLGLAILAACTLVVGAWRSEWAAVSLLAGFALWVGYVAWLMRRHLGRPC